MILPTKQLRVENSLIAVSAELVGRLDQGQTVSSLWNDVKVLPNVRTFERFTLALDLLYALGMVDFKEGLLRRNGE